MTPEMWYCSVSLTWSIQKRTFRSLDSFLFRALPEVCVHYSVTVQDPLLAGMQSYREASCVLFFWISECYVSFVAQDG
jgi:hypothetical protein